MIQYPNTELKPAIFKLWDSLGVSWRHTKYLSDQFATLMDYYLMVAEYYGIDTRAGEKMLKQTIIDEANEILSDPENQECSGGRVRMYKIDLEPGITSREKMDGFYRGYGTKPSMSFAYELFDPESFECADIPGYSKEEMWRDFLDRYHDLEFLYSVDTLKDLNPEQELRYKEFCYEEGCLRDMIDKISYHVSEKYGIKCNINVSHERDMLGNIRKTPW